MIFGWPKKTAVTFSNFCNLSQEKPLASGRSSVSGHRKAFFLPMERRERRETATAWWRLSFYLSQGGSYARASQWVSAAPRRGVARDHRAVSPERTRAERVLRPGGPECRHLCAVVSAPAPRRAAQGTVRRGQSPERRGQSLGRGGRVAQRRAAARARVKGCGSPRRCA